MTRLFLTETPFVCLFGEGARARSIVAEASVQNEEKSSKNETVMTVMTARQI